jgi:flagellar biosynthesis protein FlhF
MKIKRFEASSMSEALRKIKKEFGEDAVILSAKTSRRNSLLGKKKGEHVVVTAAIDNMPSSPDSQEMNGLGPAFSAAADQGQESRPKDHTGINILKRFNPITPTGQNKVKPKLVQRMSASESRTNDRYLHDALLSQGISEQITDDLAKKAAALLPPQDISLQDYRSALAQVMEANKLVGSQRRNQRSKQRIMVLLGPCGVGKTSAAAKLCARHAIHLQESVALVSLDNQRIAGTVELERFAHILEVPLKTAGDAEQLRTVMAGLASYDLVIIDTPGMAADDHILCERVRRIVATLASPELYLLLGADMQEQSMARAIGFFRSFEAQRIFMTRLDWAGTFGAVINQATAFDLPIAYFSESPKVPEGLLVANVMDLAARILPDKSGLAIEDSEPAVSVVRNLRLNRSGPYYVANRNSDIFHSHGCKSVKRINTENMIVFKDPAEAIGRQFKPCRMCCSELIFPKPIDRLARGYAGNRYSYQ